MRVINDMARIMLLFIASVLRGFFVSEIYSNCIVCQQQSFCICNRMDICSIM